MANGTGTSTDYLDRGTSPYEKGLSREPYRMAPDNGVVPAGGEAPAAVAPTPAFPSPFAARPSDPSLVPNEALQRCLAAIGAKTKFKHLGIALVDLTDGTNSPPYAAWNDQRQFEVASLAKIGAMYAAFRLRDAIQQAADGIKANDGQQLLTRISAQWRPVIQNRFASSLPDSPNLANIFFALPAGAPGIWIVDFRDGRKTPEELDLLHKPQDTPEKIRRLGQKVEFMDRMRLMIGWSDNSAAATCIRELGFQYINTVLADSGLYDATRGGGLWLSWDYGGGRWGGKSDPVGRTVQGATAAAVAGFLTLLAADELVSRTASEQMRELMTESARDNKGYTTYFDVGLEKAHRPPVESLGKVGISRGAHDCAIFKRTTATGVVIRYAAVGIGGWDTQVQQDLIVLLDDCIVNAHPSPTHT